MADQLLDLTQRSTDPVSPNGALPIDFAAQYPTPLNTEELVAMCEEINLWKAIPEIRTSLKQETWRELNELAFTSGSSYISFADYACPEAYYHDGDNTTVTLKNIGAYKALGISDIMHSAAVAAADWNGINQLIGAFTAGQGLPGAGSAPSFANTMVSDLKAKEMRLAATLVLNGWDRLLATGNAGSNALEFSGIETQVTAANGAHTSTDAASSGTFTAVGLDRFIAEACATPDTFFGSPQTIQEMMSSYFQLGFQGSQLIYSDNGSRLTPGYNFGGEVNTSRGLMRVVADRNFTTTASGASSFQSNIYTLKTKHNGMPLVYRSTQIPLAFKDLAEGCTSIQFMIWAKTALIIRAMCAQGFYRSIFGGKSGITTCPTI
jgi:hypothetical protein